MPGAEGLEQEHKNGMLELGCDEARFDQKVFDDLVTLRIIVKESAPGRETMRSGSGFFWPRLRISPRFPGIVPLSRSVC